LPGNALFVVKLLEEIVPRKVTLVKPEPGNAHSPILVTLLGIVMLVKPVRLNALLPILVTLLGIVTLVKPKQPLNAPLSIIVTLLGMVKLPLLPSGIRIRVVPALLYNTPSKLEKLGFAISTVMLIKLVQPRNVFDPIILVTLFPIVTLVKLVQPSNALSPMLVTLSGIIMLIKLLQ
jgi:drug/metabolite transporter (DMT)-like permease